jgi:hypothetical protein
MTSQSLVQRKERGPWRIWVWSRDVIRSLVNRVPDESVGQAEVVEQEILPHERTGMETLNEQQVVSLMNFHPAVVAANAMKSRRSR